MYIIKRGDFEMDIDPLSCAAINVVEFGPFWRAGIIKRDVIFCFFSPAVGEDEREMVELVNFKPEFSSTFTSMSKENLPTIKILIQTKLDTPTDGYHIVRVDRLRIVKTKAVEAVGELDTAKRKFEPRSVKPRKYFTVLRSHLLDFEKTNTPQAFLVAAPAPVATVR